jgi:hypothetical protein
MSNGGPSFDPARYTPEMTLAQIRELRDHIQKDLMPEAAQLDDGQFVALFVSYMDTLAARFEELVNAPLDLFAFVARNLLEFSVLLPVVFESKESETLFLNEAFRIDLQDLQTRLDVHFSEIGSQPLQRDEELDLDWLPPSKRRLVGTRTTFDSWFHKYCSKLMHPTAIMIVAGEALAGPEKRVTLCFAGLNYLGRSYNFLSGTLFPKRTGVSENVGPLGPES